MHETLIFILVVIPFLAAAGCFFLRASALRSPLVFVTCCVLATVAIILAAGGAFESSAQHVLGLKQNTVIQVADYALLLIMLLIGFLQKHRLVMTFSVAQLVLLTFFELFMLDHARPAGGFTGDPLALLMVLIISLVGSLICIYAIPYMKAHQEHLEHEGKAGGSQGRFFAVMVLFLGAMNGLVLTNDLMHFYFFFEVTALCSYLLIAQDGTEIAMKNALRALWMNSLGGFILIFGIALLYKQLHTVNIAAVIQSAPVAGKMPLPMAFICLAAFTKAAQVPFQSWLCGAMVAPTPVSALLHSSTMVKAGVYLALRFAPAYAGSLVSYGLALAGGFTFLAAAALAMGQSNGKKILAYSTISNLGLIFVCAGVNTPESWIAGMFLILFHAVSKGLLFLCVGSIEQQIGSRDIEDMRGLAGKMPRTALMTMLAGITMILPPFGMLLGKWMVIETAAANTVLVVMLAVGSALTVVYWTRWAGSLIATSRMDKSPSEMQPVLLRLPLGILLFGALVLVLFAPCLYRALEIPVLRMYNSVPGLPAVVPSLGVQLGGMTGAYWVYPIFTVAVITVILALRAMRKFRNAQYSPPYVCGAQVSEPGAFMGPMTTPVAPASGNYYLSAWFGEERLTTWLNVAAIILILFMLGGGL